MTAATTPDQSSEPPSDDSSTDADTNERDSEQLGGESSEHHGSFDLKGLLRQLTTPMVESLDARLRDQVEEHVNELLDEKVDAAIRDRLSTLDRAVADLSRSLEELERRLSE